MRVLAHRLILAKQDINRVIPGRFFDTTSNRLRSTVRGEKQTHGFSLHPQTGLQELPVLEISRPINQIDLLWRSLSCSNLISTNPNWAGTMGSSTTNVATRRKLSCNPPRQLTQYCQGPVHTSETLAFDRNKPQGKQETANPQNDLTRTPSLIGVLGRTFASHLKRGSQSPIPSSIATPSQETKGSPEGTLRTLSTLPRFNCPSR